MTQGYGIYGYNTDNNSIVTFKQETRAWRKFVKKHFDEKIDKAVETIDTNTDTRADEIKALEVEQDTATRQLINTKTNEIENHVTSAKNEILSDTRSIKSTLNSINSSLANIFHD